MHRAGGDVCEPIFKHPLRMYTGGGAGSEHYGTNIIDLYRFDYPPAQPAVIFPYENDQDRG